MVNEANFYSISDDKIKVKITNYGATITSITMNDKFGVLRDVTLGYDTIEEYENNIFYFGATIGRVGNRTENGKFTLNGVEYSSPKNDGENSLHGGINGFDKKIWKVETHTDDSLELSYLSVDGEEGYPGNLKVNVKFSVKGGRLKIEYFATTDKDTIVNLTNHSYFNLDGSGNVLDTKITIYADNVSKVKKGLIPTGELLPVADTPFDFRTEKPIRQDAFNTDEQLSLCGGYDINYLPNGNGFRLLAQARSEKTGITMKAYSDTVGMQFYAGNFITRHNGKNNAVYDKNYGFCFETQNVPNSINLDKNSPTILRKGQIHRSVTVYEFCV